MNTKKEKSKAAFDQQAATYDFDFKGSHARALYPVMLKKLSQIPFQSALDSESLPFPVHSFDVVFCNDSFHHYPAPQNVLREVHRVLKPDGTFLIGDCWQPFIGRVIMNAFMRYSKEGDVKIYSKAEMVLMLSECFHTVSWERIGNTACIAMGIK